jgi:hypothetical protein
MDADTLQKLCDHLTIVSLPPPGTFKQMDDYFDSADAVIKKISKGQLVGW